MTVDRYALPDGPKLIKREILEEILKRAHDERYELLKKIHVLDVNIEGLLKMREILE